MHFGKLSSAGKNWWSRPLTDVAANKFGLIYNETFMVDENTNLMGAYAVH